MKKTNPSPLISGHVEYLPWLSIVAKTRNPNGPFILAMASGGIGASNMNQERSLSNHFIVVIFFKDTIAFSQGIILPGTFFGIINEILWGVIYKYSYYLYDHQSNSSSVTTP